jgi:glycosyltransferase involved in cell wall biosynthesis
LRFPTVTRILHIIDSLDRSGTASQLLLVAKGLAEKGFDVHVASLDGGRFGIEEFSAAGMPVTRLNCRWPIDPIAFVRFQRLLFGLRPELVHTWDIDAGVHGRIAARMAGVRRFIASYHRMDRSLDAWDWFLERRLARFTDRLIASSRWMFDSCLQHGLPADKLVLIPPGVPPARASDLSREELLRELGLPAGAKLIGVVDRLVPASRVKDLIWAADLLRVLHDNLRLLIIGGGPLRSQLEEYARMASDLDHIQFLGERADTWRILPHFDVLWNARENAGPSSAILQAMAAGVPVVASDSPSNRELVVENETGYLIPPGIRAGRAARARHTDRIFSEEELTSRLTVASRRRLTNDFSAAAMVFHYNELYTGL